MKLADIDIKERLTDFSSLGITAPSQKILKMINEGNIPSEVEKALKEGKIIIDPLPNLEPTENESSFLGSSTIDLQLGIKFETLNAPFEVADNECGGKIIRRCVFDINQKSKYQNLREYTGVTDEQGGWISFEIGWNDTFQLDPNVQVNAFTKQIVCIPDDLEGDLGGRSSMARKGISAHISSSRFDAGFCGGVTMEINNSVQCSFFLKPGTRFCSLGFHQLSRKVAVPYYHKKNAHFSGQH